jgi:hypothetical protein
MRIFAIAVAFLLGATLDPAEADRVRAAYEKTTLVVPVPSADAGAGPAEFWVQYGKRTNAPARLFGPFPL